MKIFVPNQEIFFKCKKKCKNGSLHAKNLTQMKNKYVHVKAEVLRISKLVHFLTLIDPTPICPDEDRPGMFLSSDYLRTEPG